MNDFFHLLVITTSNATIIKNSMKISSSYENIIVFMELKDYYTVVGPFQLLSQFFPFLPPLTKLRLLCIQRWESPDVIRHNYKLLTLCYKMERNEQD